MDAACDDIGDGNSNNDSRTYVTKQSLANETTVSDGTTTDGRNQELQSTTQDVCAREVAIQANDYDIERISSYLPARKRYIPLKFSDYRIFAGGSQIAEKEDEKEEEDEDVTFNPDKHDKKPLKSKSGRGRGRPRKNGSEGVSQEREKKTTITKVHTGFKCGICARIFSLRGNAKAHLITHTDQKPFACDFEGCGKQLRTKESLRRHQLSHLGIKMFECSECKKKFSSNASLQEHMARHTGAKPLSCNVCGINFRQLAVLKRHIATHSDDKPFACGVCGKRFSMKVYVRSHMKIHTGERPFTCDTCHKSFAHASDLNRHKIIHTGKKPYACSVCSVRYSDASSRRRHEREHQNKPQYMCHLCDQYFTRAGQLRSHHMREHNSLIETLFEVQVLDKGAEQTDAVRPEEHRDDVVAGMPVSEQILIEPSSLAQSASDCKDDSQPVNQVFDSKTEAISEPAAFMEDFTDIQPGCTFRIIGHDDGNHIYELKLEDGGHIPLEELANRINEGDIQLQANDASLTFIQEADNTYGIIQHPQAESSSLQPPEQIIDLSEKWQADANVSQEVLQRALLHKSTQEADEEPNILPVPKTKTEDLNLGEMTVNVYHEDTMLTTSAMIEKTQTSETQLETWSLPAKTIVEPFSESFDYIYNPDLNSQDYYNWLSTFTEECKLLSLPLDKSTFQNISHVQKTLSDFMASPSGVITDKNNFRVLMSISQDLLDIIGKHLALMLENLP
ncbi:hypothetical protein BsWGS_04699 [Bradybaena similaris]